MQTYQFNIKTQVGDKDCEVIFLTNNVAIQGAQIFRSTNTYEVKNSFNRKRILWTPCFWMSNFMSSDHTPKLVRNVHYKSKNGDAQTLLLQIFKPAYCMSKA